LPILHKTFCTWQIGQSERILNPNKASNSSLEELQAANPRSIEKL
jgi:hypothetical protein